MAQNFILTGMKYSQKQKRLMTKTWIVGSLVILVTMMLIVIVFQ